MNNLSIRKKNELLKKKKKGFTLVELIIVIAIIAILAAIALPKFGEIRSSANTKADVATAKNIATVVASGIASSDIKLPTSATDYALTAVGETGGSVDISAKLDGKTTTKAKVGDTFKVNITPDGNISVKYGTANTRIYPES